MNTSHDIEALVRQALADHARLNGDARMLDENADLYQAGMNSHASVNVMLALEAAMDTEFPDEMLRRSVFSRIATIRDALVALRAAA